MQANQRSTGVLRGLRALTLALGILLIASAAKAEAQQLYGYPLIVQNPLGVARTNAPVASGICAQFPGLVADPNTVVQLVDDQGNLVPVQFKVLARWHGQREDWTRGIKWLLVEFLADVPANGYRVYSLRGGPRTHGQIVTQDLTNTVEISTGVADFTLSKTSYNVFQQVKVGGQIVTDGPGSLICHDVQNQLVGATLTSTEIEEPGDVRVVVKQKGQLAGIGLHFTVRYYFWTGRSDVRVEFRLENHGTYGELPYLGSQIQHSHFEDISLNVKTLDLQSSIATTAATRVTGGAPYALSQNWNTPVDTLKMLDGFVFDETINGTGIGSGGRYAGALALNGAGGSVAASVDRFWQMFPKAFDTQADRMGVHIFPAFGSGPHYTGQYGLPTDPVTDTLSNNFYRFEGGRWRTHTIDFAFRTGTFSPADLTKMAQETNSPLMAMTPPDWPFKCLAFGTLAMERRSWALPSFQRFEKMMDVLAHDSAADNQPSLGRIGLPEFRNRGGTYGGQLMFGWENYGDIMWGDGFSSCHYDLPFSVLLNWFRTGDYAFFDVGRDMAAERRDYNQMHITSSTATRRGGQTYEKGYFHGNYNQPEPSHTWIQGLLLYYIMTGDESSREAALESWGFFQRNHPESWDGWWGSRILGWQLEGLMDLYNYIGDQQYINLALQVVQRYETLEQQWGGHGYVPNPAWTGNVHEQTWMHCIVFNAIGKYYYASLNPNVLPLMRRMANWIMSDVIKTAPSGPLTARTTAKVWGRAATSYHDEPSTHHVWITCDALTWAALCLHDNTYMAMAGDLWESITRYHQKDVIDESPENYTNPTYFSKIAFRMLQYPNAETKIMSNIALWGQGYVLGRMVWDHQWL